MSSTNRRFVVAYILLVGLPLAGLAGVLKAGRHLAAPIAIDGSWKLEAEASHPASPCDQAIASLLSSNLIVSQSGRSLELTLGTAPKIEFLGQLEGNNIGGSMTAASGCGDDQPVILAASIDPKSEPKSLAGTLSVGNCTSCTRVEFRAVRQQKAQSGGGH